MASSSQAAPAFVRLAAHPLRWRLLTELAGSDLRVRELVARVGEPQNLISYHLRLLRGGGLVAATRSSFDGRDSYYRLDLDRCAQALAGTGAALHPALRGVGAPTTSAIGQQRWPRLAVLFVCTGNSARSPIAEALLRHHTAGRVSVISAGSRPKSRLHPHAVQVLRERYGIDIADQQPRHLDTLAGRRFEYVITLCDKAREVCPDFGGSSRKVHWSIPDPATVGDAEQGAGTEPADRTERAEDTDSAGHAAFSRAAADIDTRIRYLLPVLAQTSEAHQ